MGIWRGPDGIGVEAIVLDHRPCLRVSRLVHGTRYRIAYCSSVREIEQHVDLADLVEVIKFPGR